MKKSALYSVICILILGQAQAQNIHTWKMGPLTWNDFTPNTAIEKQVSHLEYYMGIDSRTKEVDGVCYSKPIAYAYTSPEYSWVDTNYLSSQLLQYNQCIFDLVELYRRQLEGKLQDSSIFTPSQLLNNTMRLLGDDVRRIEIETQYGTDTAALHRWQAKIQAQLDATNPTTTAYGHTDAPFAWGMSTNFALHCNGGELREYFSHGLGMSMNYEMQYKRSLWGAGLQLGGSKCLKVAPNVRDSNDSLFVDDPLVDIGFYGYCGISVIDNSRTRLTPFVGYGLLGYYYTPDDGSSSLGSGNGCFHFGVIYNRIFCNEVTSHGITNDYYNADHGRIYVDVRLYGTYNNFKSIVGAPRGFTLNLQIGIGLSYVQAHCR